MRFSTFIPLALAARVLAVPHKPRSNPDEEIRRIQTSTNNIINKLAAQGCDYIACVAALAKDTAACGAAAEELGSNILADLACFASVGTTIDNSACAECIKMTTLEPPDSS